MRLEKLDIFRWVAIFLMIIFHLNYTLINIFSINLLNFSNTFWFIIWKISVFLFIFISWIWFFLAEKKYNKKIIKKYIKVSAFLWIIAIFISIITYFILDWQQYIKFWIIHFFSLSFLLLLIFRLFKFYNLFLWTIILIYGLYFIPIINSEYFYYLWFTYPWFKSADYYPIIPYFWIMLYWYIFALFLDKIGKIYIFKIKGKNNFIWTLLSYMWKKSLLIYIIHQPIIILILYIIFGNNI